MRDVPGACVGRLLASSVPQYYYQITTRPRTTQKRRSTHAPGQSRMRRAWNHALSQARLRRRRRWASVFFRRLRLWTLAGTFPVPYPALGRLSMNTTTGIQTKLLILGQMRLLWAFGRA